MERWRSVRFRLFEAQTPWRPSSFLSLLFSGWTTRTSKARARGPSGASTSPLLRRAPGTRPAEVQGSSAEPRGRVVEPGSRD